MVNTGLEVIWGNVHSITQAHETVRWSVMLNFMQLRIAVQTQLKVNAGKKYLY